jgi:hypothetical protein
MKLKSDGPILDLPPDSHRGEVLTVILLTVGNFVVPLASYLWGLIRLTQTPRWSVWQKALLLLLFPAPFLIGFGLLWPTSTKTSVSCVSRAPYPEVEARCNDARHSWTFDEQ